MPTRQPDSLESKEFITIQDLLSEGEIEGFATPSKKGIARTDASYNNACLADIFLDDTAVINIPTADPNFVSRVANLTAPDFSFKDVSFEPRFGTSNQVAVQGIENDTFNKTTNTILSNSAIVTDSTFVDTPNITIGKHAVQITIQFQALQKFEDNGDILGTEVHYQIQRQLNSGAFEIAIDEVITGRSKDLYSREHTLYLPNTRFGLPNYTQAKFRIVRITPDSDTDSISDLFRVSRVEEVIFDAQSYPDCAYTTLRLSAEQFSNIPRRAFRIRGLKIQIPGAGANNSGTPTVDNQTGRIIYPSGYIFNGTMGNTVWCTCPSMILLDLLVNKRYGLGVHIAPDDSNKYANIDLFSYVQASKYANEEVVLEDGSREARFSCNVAIQGTDEAFNLINELAGVMRSFPIWQTGTITITQDRPTDPSYLFSLANVGETGFTYQGSSLKQRHSVIAVSYFNMDNQEIDYEVVEDPIAIQKYGSIKKTIKAFGTTSRSQAARLGKAVLFSEQQESELVSFSTSIDAGVLIRPGSIIAVSDPVRSVERRSGRVKSATATEITVDDRRDLNRFLGTNKTVRVLLSGGQTESRSVTSISGDVITVSSPFSEAPENNSVWMLSSLGSNGLEPQTFRVISIEEQEEVNYAITALTYIPGKYDNIERGIPLPQRFTSLLNRPRNPPSNLTAQEVVYIEGGFSLVKIILSWIPVTGVSQYQVHYRFNNSNWTVENVFRPDFEIFNTSIGTYEFKVYSYNAALQLSNTFSSLLFVARGKVAPPANVQNLTFEPVNETTIRLRWDLSTDPDVIHGGRVYVRHNTIEEGQGTFQNSVDLIEALPGNSTEALVPALDGEYIIKFRDALGTFSTGETSIILDLPDEIDAQEIINDREDTDLEPFSGIKIDTQVVDGNLQLADPDTDLSGTYDFAQVLDCGAVFSLNLRRFIKTTSFFRGQFIDQLIPPGQFWDDYARNGNFDGPSVETTHASISVSTTNGDPSDPSVSFSDFQTFANGVYKGRGFRFRVNLRTENPAHNIKVTRLGIIADLRARTERAHKVGSNRSNAPLSSGTNADGLDVVFANSFFVGTDQMGGLRAFKPALGITIMNASGGEHFVIKQDSNGDFLNAANEIVTGTGFNISILDGQNNPVNKNFTFQAVGYGKGV